MPQQAVDSGKNWDTGKKQKPKNSKALTITHLV